MGKEKYAIILLIATYLVAMGVGLPSSLIGAAWPVMHADLGLDIGAAGIFSIIIYGGNTVGSLLCVRLARKLGTGPMMAVFMLLLGACLAAFAFFRSFALLAALCAPLGVAMGLMDAGTSNFIVLHYKARYMSWLQCAWGAGAALGPVIMAGFLANAGNWQGGFFCIALILLGLAAALFCSLPLWRGTHKRAAPAAAPAAADAKSQAGAEGESARVRSARVRPARVRGMYTAILLFFVYCGLELTLGVWGTSYLTEIRGVSPADAASWISYYYLGITAGRLVAGFATMRFSGIQLVRSGLLTTALGILLLLLPLPAVAACFGIVLIGLGLSPFYPSLLQDTPARFGIEHSQRMISLQIAAAFAGSTVLPPLLGAAVSAGVPIGAFPWFLAAYGGLLIAGVEILQRITRPGRSTRSL